MFVFLTLLTPKRVNTCRSGLQQLQSAPPHCRQHPVPGCTFWGAAPPGAGGGTRVRTSEAVLRQRPAQQSLQLTGRGPVLLQGEGGGRQGPCRKLSAHTSERAGDVGRGTGDEHTGRAHMAHAGGPGPHSAPGTTLLRFLKPNPSFNPPQPSQGTEP